MAPSPRFSNTTLAKYLGEGTSQEHRMTTSDALFVCAQFCDAVSKLPRCRRMVTLVIVETVQLGSWSATA